MIKKSLKSWFFIAVLLGVSSQASANRTVIYGQDLLGNLTELQGKVCVLPTQGLRLRADVVNQFGQRIGLPVNFFIWRLTRSNGRYVQWDARYDSSFGPWEMGDEPHSVYLWLSDDLGKNGKLEAVTPNTQSDLVNIVDPTHPNNTENCTWAPEEIYMIPDDGFPTEPDPTLEPCYNVCTVGKYCIDGCPFGASCRFVAEQPQPYWHIRACR